MSSRITSGLGSLGERVARMGGTAPDSPVRHVLVLDGTGTWQPALLIGWQRQPSGWWGRVVMLDPDEPALVDVAAGRLRPADCTCCTSQDAPSARRVSTAAANAMRHPTATGTTTPDQPNPIHENPTAHPTTAEPE